MINCCQKGLGTAQKVAQKLAELGMMLAPEGFAHSALSWRHASLIHLMESNPKGNLSGWPGTIWLRLNILNSLQQIGLWPLVAAGLQGGQKALLLSGRWKSVTGDTDGGRNGFSTDSKMGAIMQLKLIDLMA